MIIPALQDEITALIDRQKELMSQLKGETLLWQSSESKEEITRKKLTGFQEALDSDAHKVRSLESIVAVIGTMKAGKSTTINALIGENVLPYRVTAMTTLPTLIRHKPGQKEPRMTLKTPQVFQQLVNSVLDKINTSNLQESDRIRLQESINTVESAGEIQSVYSGKEAIHKALFIINDTFRLAGHEKININLDEQLRHFTELSSLPTVEVEFRCLANKPEGQYAGSLALLDTPGPNEAGQNRVLKNILTEQIEKNASMVLLVMNYTQLNTEQDSEIRNQLRGIKEVFKDRSFVVVNRFDEKKKGDPDKDQIRKLASELLNESLGEDDFISEKEVFPVSSHRAYISENAKQQLSQGVSLDDFINDDDNEDFITAAFGEIDNDELEDLEKHEIEKKAERLLKNSGYDVFISNMLEKAYFKAGQTSLQAALGRLINNSGKLDRFSTVVTGGLAQELGGINADIQKTRDLIDSVDSVYQEVDAVKKSGVSEYRNAAAQVLRQFEDQIGEEMRALFSNAKEKKSEELGRHISEKEKEKGKFTSGNFISYWRKSNRQERDRIFEEIKELKGKLEEGFDAKGVIDFGSDEEAAKTFISQSSDLLEDYLGDAASTLSEKLSEIESDTKKSIQETLFKKIRYLCDAYESHLKKKGFDFNISLFDGLSLDVTSGLDTQVEIDEAVEHSKVKGKEYTRKKKYRSGVVHGTLKFIFGGLRDDYDVETIKTDVEKDNYKISMSDLINLAITNLKRFCGEIDKNMNREFEEILIPAVDNVFEQVIVAIKGIEEALEQSKKLKQNNADDIRRLSITLDSIKMQNNNIRTRCETARTGLSLMSS